MTPPNIYSKIRSSILTSRNVAPWPLQKKLWWFWCHHFIQTPFSHGSSHWLVFLTGHGRGRCTNLLLEQVQENDNVELLTLWNEIQPLHFASKFIILVLLICLGVWQLIGRWWMTTARLYWPSDQRIKRLVNIKHARNQGGKVVDVIP